MTRYTMHAAPRLYPVAERPDRAEALGRTGWVLGVIALWVTLLVGIAVEHGWPAPGGEEPVGHAAPPLVLFPGE